ncbi:MAG: alpha/beta hydrolase [bacterium]|nr:alpha/beta hydrolase [Gammaproteobacteria bacterium]
MASEELRATIELIRGQEGVTAEGLSLQERREGMEAMQANIPLPEDINIEKVDIDGIPGIWVTAPGARDNAYVVYYHGGGYVMGSLDTHKELMGRISRSCKATVLGVDYRLAPEHLYPAAVEDGVKSYEWLLARDVDPSTVMMAGDSAGGGLVISTMLALKDKGGSQPAGGILFSPWTDLTASGDSATTRAEADPMITMPALLEIAETYYAGSNPKDPLISPVFADLAGLPPLLIQVGDAEVLLDDASRLADNARAAGIPVQYQVWDEAFHVFQAMPHLPEATDALQKVANFYTDIVN